MAEALVPRPRRSPAPWFRRGSLPVLRELEDAFERFWEEEPNGWGAGMLAPPMDLSENDQDISLRMDLPGVSPKEIDIQVNGNLLIVSGERKEEKEEKNETFHRVERRAGRFSRSITLPCLVEEDKIEAQYRDGVLTVNLPKTAEARPRHIEVKT